MWPADLSMNPRVGAEPILAGEVQAPPSSSRARIVVRQALDLIDAPSAALDPLGQIVEVNRAWDAAARVGGATTLNTGAGVSYLAVCDMAAGEDTAGAAESAAGIRSVLSGAATHFALDYPRRDRWYSIRVTPLGGFGGAVVTHLDITSLKEAELRLQREERRLHLPFDESSPIFALIDEGGVVRHRSEVTSRLLGLEVEVQLGQSAFDRIDPADQERAGATLASVASTPGSMERVELTVIDGEGRRRLLDVVAVNLLHEPAVGAIVVTGSDITESRSAQISRRLERKLLSGLPTAVVVTDEHDVVVYWNERASEIFGYASGDALGRSIDQLLIGPGGVEEVDQMRAVTLADGHWEGEYDARRADGSVVAIHTTLERVNDEDIGFHGLVGTSVDISERRRLEADLAFQVLHDTLTGLPNREMFVEHLDGAVARGARRDGLTAVLVIDIDDFGSVNGAFGHGAGDSVLRAVAELVSGAGADGDVVARLGGDEFVLCCEDVGDTDAAYAAADRVLKALDAPFRLGGRLVTVTASIGVAMSGPSRNGEVLLRNAESALSAAKDSGKHCVQLFDDARHERARKRHELALELDHAIDAGELVTWFQPEIDLVTGALFGFEALVRWQHPERGLVAPDEFIGIAEERGLIGRIGSLVLRYACQALAAWLDLAPGHPLTVSVNVSVHQLLDPELATIVAAAIDESGVPADRICLEITESALVVAPEAAEVLRALRATGVTVALDDFGTGYSSLSRLKRFPVDFLKIDREFVSGLGHDGHEDDAIVTAIVHVARALGLRIIAEGIETTEQLAVLTELGCEYGQGYLWSRPLQSDEATAFVHADPCHRIEPAGR